MRSWAIALGVVLSAQTARADELFDAVEPTLSPLIALHARQVILAEVTTRWQLLSLHDTHPAQVHQALSAALHKHFMSAIPTEMGIHDPDQAATLLRSGVDAVLFYQLDSKWGTPRLRIWISAANGNAATFDIAPPVDGLLSISWWRIGVLAAIGFAPLVWQLRPRRSTVPLRRRRARPVKPLVPPVRKYEDGVPFSDGALEMMKSSGELAKRARPNTDADPGQSDFAKKLADVGIAPKPPVVSTSPQGIDLPKNEEARDTLVDGGPGVADTISIRGSATTPPVIRERYRIIAEVGRGAMGVVYCARDLKLDRDVALKVMSDEVRSMPEALKMFSTEAKALAQLNHPNIVAIYDQADEGGEAMLVMEMIEGTTLDHELRKGPLPWRDALEVVDRLCAALAYAHGKGVIHRDVKPANIFITKEHDLKLADFGLARVTSAVIGRSTQYRGTPLYMSPEQITGSEIDHRADLYAVGSTMFELITGRTVFTEGDFLYQHVHVTPPVPSSIVPDIPPELDALFLALARKTPEERPRSAAAVRGMIAAILKLPPPEAGDA